VLTAIFCVLYFGYSLCPEWRTGGQGEELTRRADLELDPGEKGGNMKGQKAVMLKMLRSGKCRNVDFVQARIYNYTARASELRDLGYNVKCIGGKGGTQWYELIEEQPDLFEGVA
jgi:hypothetical protein